MKVKYSACSLVLSPSYYNGELQSAYALEQTWRRQVQSKNSICSELLIPYYLYIQLRGAVMKLCGVVAARTRVFPQDAYSCASQVVSAIPWRHMPYRRNPNIITL